MFGLSGKRHVEYKEVVVGYECPVCGVPTSYGDKTHAHTDGSGTGSCPGSWNRPRALTQTVEVR